MSTLISESNIVELLENSFDDSALDDINADTSTESIDVEFKDEKIEINKFYLEDIEDNFLNIYLNEWNKKEEIMLFIQDGDFLSNTDDNFYLKLKEKKLDHFKKSNINLLPSALFIKHKHSNLLMSIFDYEKTLKLNNNFVGKTSIPNIKNRMSTTYTSNNCLYIYYHGTSQEVVQYMTNCLDSNSNGFSLCYEISMSSAIFNGIFLTKLLNGHRILFDYFNYISQFKNLPEFLATESDMLNMLNNKFMTSTEKDWLKRKLKKDIYSLLDLRKDKLYICEKLSSMCIDGYAYNNEKRQNLIKNTIEVTSRFLFNEC